MFLQFLWKIVNQSHDFLFPKAIKQLDYIYKDGDIVEVVLFFVLMSDDVMVLEEQTVIFGLNWMLFLGDRFKHITKNELENILFC